MGVGAIAGLVANPVVGALSDRTTSPRGKDAGIINALVVAPLAAGVVLG